MIISYDQVIQIVPHDPSSKFTWEEVIKLMHETERLTKDEVMNDIGERVKKLLRIDW